MIIQTYFLADWADYDDLKVSDDGTLYIPVP